MVGFVRASVAKSPRRAGCSVGTTTRKEASRVRVRREGSRPRDETTTKSETEKRAGIWLGCGRRRPSRERGAFPSEGRRTVAIRRKGRDAVPSEARGRIAGRATGGEADSTAGGEAADSPVEGRGGSSRSRRRSRRRGGEVPRRCEWEGDGGEKGGMHEAEVGCGRGRAGGHGRVDGRIDEGRRSKDGAAAEEEDGNARDRGDGEEEERNTEEEDGPEIDICAGVP